MGRSLASEADMIGVVDMLVAALSRLDANGFSLTAIRVQHALDTLLTESGGSIDPSLPRSGEEPATVLPLA